jgi:predicted TIM-barrel enzyme
VCKDELCAGAVAEARVYREAGFHGLVIENMHDRPYLAGTAGPGTVAALAVRSWRRGSLWRHRASVPTPR